MVASGFGPLLRAKRLAAGLSQEELADRATISVRTISSLERGRSQPYLKTVRLLAEALELTEADRDQFIRAARRLSYGAGGPEPGPASGPRQAATHQAPAAPHELPAAPTDFTGRLAELKTLAALLAAEPRDGGDGGDDGADAWPGDLADGTGTVLAIGGTAGVGKTALALYWAHQIAGRFPDGQLYVNLRGYDPDQPVTAADALAGFLRALGVPGPEIPPDPQERAARYRSLLAGRRMLVLLDNAGSVEQVRPLLPGTGSCVTLITSRDALAGLVVREGARRLDLDLLSPAEADVLLARLIGDRAAADPPATAGLAAACARLPLALRVAAEIVVARPSTSIADLVTGLADRQRRLDLLEAGGDPRTAVRTVFSWSCQHLDPETGRVFRMLGLHPGPDLEPYAVAALAGTTVAQARRRLDLLARAHLIQPAEAGRYGLHDLLRAYARELAAGQDGEDESRAALTRLFDHCLHAAGVAMNQLQPAERHRRPPLRPPSSPAPPMPGQDEAQAWLDAQRATLVAVAAYTAEHGWPHHATDLGATLFRYLESGGHYPECTTVQTCARRAARAMGDRAAEATALNHVCVVSLRQGRYREAVGLLQQALALYRENGDRGGQARVLGNLGIADYILGRFPDAIGHHGQALDLYRQIGDRIGEVRTLNNLGLVELRLGRYEQATGYLRQGLALAFRAGREPRSEFSGGFSGQYVLANLGVVGWRQGRWRQATDYLQRAVTLCRQAGYQTGEAYALTYLGLVELRLGRYQQAAGLCRQAMALCRDNGEQGGEIEALNALGEVHLAAGRPAAARAQHAAALRLARQLGEPYEEARALAGLGSAHRALGHPGLARQHWRDALALFAGMGLPEAGQVRSGLSEMEGQPR
jgi:tetratricopeptide (TPR) repeat protein/transcriptional regulator with XRE-family HTH domain